jgi:thiol:disulfide interchange protein
LPRSDRRGGALAQLAVLVAAFAVATLIARISGAGWGTSSAFGQLTFVFALVAVLLTDRP